MRFWPCSLIFLIIAAPIYGASIFHQPVTSGVTGIPVRIKASIDNPNQFLYAQLFYKKASDGFFKRANMSGSGRRFAAEIEGSEMAIQGTHYFIEVTLQDNSKVTLPSGAPANFFTIKNSEATSTVNISVVSPQNGQRIEDRRPEITAAVRGLEYLSRREKIVVFIDEAVVPHEFQFGFLRHKPENDFSIGRHVIRIQIFDEQRTLISETKSEFYVDAELDPADKIKILEDKKENAETIRREQDKWKKSGNLNFTYQYAKTEPVTTAVANPDGYYTMEAQYRASKDKLSFFLGPTYITNQANEGGSRIEKMSFGIAYDHLSTKWGTVSTQLTDYTEGGAAFLGGEVAYDSLTDEKQTGLRVKAFSGETKEAVERVLDPSGVGIYRQRAFGGQVAWAPFKNLGYVSFQAINRADDETSISELSLNQVRNDTSASVMGRIFLPQITINQIEAEYGVTQSNTKTPLLNDVEEIELVDENSRGQGFRLSTDGNIKALATKYNVDFKRNDPRFLYEGDLLYARGGLSHTLFKGALTLKENVKYETDNLEGQKIQTTINQSAGGDISVSVGGFSANVSDNISEKIITGDNLTQQTDQVSNDFNSNVSYSFKVWRISFSPGLTFNQQDIVDLSSPRVIDDQRNRTYQGTLGLEFDLVEWVRLYGDASYNYTTAENLTQGTLSESQSPAGNINLDFKFLNGKFTQKNKMSYVLNSIITQNPMEVQINSVLTTSYESSLEYSQISWFTLGADFKFERNENKSGPRDNLNLSIGVSRSEGARVTFKMFNEKLSIPITANHSVNFDQEVPQKTNSDTVNTTAGVTFKPDEVQTLKLDGAFTRFIDRINAGSSYDQYSVTFSYNAVLQ